MGQTPNPPLKILLPKLQMVFRRDGLSEEAATFFLTAIRTRANQRPLETAEHYREAWVAAQAVMDVLTSDDDGSEAASWLHAVSHAIFDYEDAYEKQHGYRPLLRAAPIGLTRRRPVMAERFPCRGYDILPSRQWSNWCVSIYPTHVPPPRLSIDIGHFETASSGRDRRGKAGD